MKRRIMRLGTSRLICGLIVGALTATGWNATQAAEKTTVTTEDAISRAIREVTGRAARPDETNPSRFGLGYDEVKARVESTYFVCSDASISRAVAEVTGRAARGMSDQGECNPLLYGDNKDYDSLKAKVQSVLVDKPFAIGTCRSAELTRAISEVKKEMGMTDVTPLGAGESGECNSGFYGNPSSYPELKNNVRAMLTNFQASGVKFDISDDGTTRTRGGDCAWWDAGCQMSRFRYWMSQQLSQPGNGVQFQNGTRAVVTSPGQIQVTDRYGRIVAAGGGNLIGNDAGSFQVVVNGRIIAAGGGNLINK